MHWSKPPFHAAANSHAVQSWAGSPVQHQNISLKDNFTDMRSQAILRAASEPGVGPALLPVQTALPVQARVLCGDPEPSPLVRQRREPAVGSPATKRHIRRTCNRSSSPQGAILQLGNNLVEGLNQLSDSKSSTLRLTALKSLAGSQRRPPKYLPFSHRGEEVLGAQCFRRDHEQLDLWRVSQLHLHMHNRLSKCLR